MLVVSFIRHGESLDNLKPIWAGSRDAELSELGVRQAKALGESYANIRLEAIITSDLKRAHATAVALLGGQSDPKPSFKVDPDLQEQDFGDAEGQPALMHKIPNTSLEDHFKDGLYPVLFERDEKFPNGEAVNDVAARAERAIQDLVLKPYLARAISLGAQDVHIAVVSHGICISELIPALLKRNVEGSPTKDYRGLVNTAWTRVTVQPKPGTESQGNEEPENLPPLIVAVTDVNRHEHILNVKRQKGIVKHDPKQRGIREFLGGGGKKKLVEVEINAVDGAGVEEHN